MTDPRADVVDRLTELLERDVIDVDVYQRLVERVLGATDNGVLEAVLADLPVAPALVIHCREGVVKERPDHVPTITALTCDSGVMKIDLSEADFDRDVDLDVECDSGVMTIVLPRDVRVAIAGREGEGGVLVNRLRAGEAALDSPRVHVYVHNGGGVVTLRHRRRWLSFRPDRTR